MRLPSKMSSNAILKLHATPARSAAMLESVGKQRSLDPAEHDDLKMHDEL
jgi:hypothetical protein